MALVTVPPQSPSGASVPTTGFPALPRHPLLRPLRSSRAYEECVAGNEDPTTGIALNAYRTSLHQLLDSERWAHHRTMQSLKAEIGHRKQLERQLSYVRAECQGLANGLAYSAQNLMHCDAERIEMIRQVSGLREEVVGWQIAYNQALQEVWEDRLLHGLR